MDEEILNELKLLNEKLSEDLKMRSEELKLQREKMDNELELQQIESERAELEAPNIELQKAKDEKRAVQLEQFIQGLEEQQEEQVTLNQESLEFRENVLEALESLDQQESFTNLGSKLDVLIQSTEVPEATQVANEFSHFTDLSMVTLMFAFIPAILTYKGLSRLFDSAFA